MITAITRVKSTDGVSMVLESSVAVVEDGDIVSYERKSFELSCQDWQRESMRFHEDLCQAILLKSSQGRNHESLRNPSQF